MIHQSPIAFLTPLGGLVVAAFLGANSAWSTEATSTPDNARHVVEVTAEDFAYRIPDTLPSGWTTIRFENDGEEHHMMIMLRLPEGKTYDEFVIEITEPYNRIWHQLRAGEITEAEGWKQRAETLPDWLRDVGIMGGPGLLAPGETTEVTLYLEPGNYVVECYMKSTEGEIHALEGMSDPVKVIDESSGGTPPSADAVATISQGGIELTGELTAGRRTIEVHVTDRGQKFGHNLHLARLDAGQEVDDILGWENWMRPDGMQNPAPAHFTGGMHLLSVGGQGYFTTDLEAGRYLLLSESGLSKEFTVPF